MSPAGSLEQLLAVQDLDTAIDQARHRLANLPEQARLAEVHAELARVQRRRADADARRTELVQVQTRYEDEISRVTEKAGQVDKTLYSGTVSAPRELQAMQDELASLGRRQHDLEDRVLEVMEQIEPVEAELAGLDAATAALDAEAVELVAAIAEAEAAGEAELARLAAERADAAAGVPPETVADYESLRRRLGGIAVARLVGTSCMGCHLTLPAVEIDRIRHLSPDVPVHCDECGRLLVRAAPTP